MKTKLQSTENLQNKANIPYKQCLNCGTDLQGIYCHKCGQQASNPNPNIWEFVLEYMNNAFIWDPKCFITIWHLIRRPGYLTNEFNAGRFTAYEHPLKLNMFFLFVFVTIFLLFSDIKKADESFENITRSEIVRPFMVLDALNQDADYSDKMAKSEKDTVKIAMPSAYAEEFPHIVSTVTAITNHGEERLDTMVVAIPRILIQDKILTIEDQGIYSFSEKNAIVDKLLGLDLLSSICSKMLEILAQYFPLIFLLTSPLLAFAVQLLHLRRKRPAISFFIFALHYTAFIELMLLLIYLLYLVVQPSFDTLQWVITLSSCVYLSIAVKNVFKSNSWLMSVLKALLISLIYLMICCTAFFITLIITIIIVVI